MRIVIDMQAAQIGGRLRNLGRFISLLVREVIHQNKDYEIILALNGLLQESIEPIRGTFNNILPQERIQVWYTPERISGMVPENAWRHDAAELIRESFLSDLQPDVVWLTNPLNGYYEDSIGSIERFNSNLPTIVTINDVNSILQPEKTLAASSAYNKYYLPRLDDLKKAKYTLVTSETVAEETIKVVSAQPESVINISIGCDAAYRELGVSDVQRQDIVSRFCLNKPFVIAVIGGDQTKSAKRVVDAFDQLPSTLKATLQLMLIGDIVPFDTIAQCATSKQETFRRVIFAGNLRDSDLAIICNLCEGAIVLASSEDLDEMTVLELMSCGTPFIVSSSEKLREIVGRTDVFFDPSSVDSLTIKMQEMLKGDAFKKDLRSYGLQQREKFSIKKSGRRVIDTFDMILSTQTQLQRDLPADIGNPINYALAEISSSSFRPTDADIVACAWSIAQNKVNRAHAFQRQLFIDVSNLVNHDHRTGVQRVVRATLRELLEAPPTEFCIEPVYAKNGHKGYFYAKKLKWNHTELCEFGQIDEPIIYNNGDVFLGLDIILNRIEEQYQYLRMLYNHGVHVHFVVYDLLPVLISGIFPPEIEKRYLNWLQKIATFSGAACISRTVAEELDQWLTLNGPARWRPFDVGWFHLGGDIENSSPSEGMPSDAEQLLSNLQGKTNFLMVGTIEPRKGHAQVLAAAEQLWNQGVDFNLVIVGRKGWMVQDLIATLQCNKELGHRLYWLQGISDEYLQKLYNQASCLIAASKGEGFGLPLIEAAQKKLPIIARDIPVFREVARDHAYYFSGDKPENLTKAIKEWLDLNEKAQVPQSIGMPWLSWNESAVQLLNVVLGERCLNG